MKPTTTLPTTLRRVTFFAVLVGLTVLTYSAMKEVQKPVALRHGERASPWRGVPGCLLLKNTSSGITRYWPLAQGMELACPADAARATGLAVPAHAKNLVNALYPLIEPPPDARMAHTETVTVSGQTIAKSPNVTLTLDPVATQLANALASCMTTANAADCQTAQLDPSRFAHLHEGAGARMLALVDMRIDTGALEVIASSHSACFAQMLTKPDASYASTTPEGCPQMPPQYLKANAWRSENHALYNQAMWASLVKPALALALLRGGAIKTKADQAWLMQALKTSNTPALLDRIFCKSQGFDPHCKPLGELAAAGLDLGYVTDYAGSDPLAAIDLLRGSASQLKTPAAHWLARAPEKAKQPWQAIDTRMPQPALLKDCAQRKWSECRGEHLAELAAHGWGQSDGKATALDAAAAFARLGAAANGLGEAYQPTLLMSQPVTLRVEPQFASVIVQGMAQTHTQGGTAHSACLAVWGSAKACNQLTILAGKTGTQTFPHDALTLAQRYDHCQSVAQRLAVAKQMQAKLQAKDTVEDFRCKYAPYKWYVALAKDSAAPGAPWSRAIAVLVERNWSLGSHGRVDSAFDKGINLAAFTAMHYLHLRQSAAQPPAIITATPTPQGAGT